LTAEADIIVASKRISGSKCGKRYYRGADSTGQIMHARKKKARARPLATGASPQQFPFLAPERKRRDQQLPPKLKSAPGSYAKIQWEYNTYSIA